MLRCVVLRCVVLCVGGCSVLLFSIVLFRLVPLCFDFVLCYYVLLLCSAVIMLVLYSSLLFAVARSCCNVLSLLMSPMPSRETFVP